jgi:SAM-dependent methyltransferase
VRYEALQSASADMDRRVARTRFTGRSLHSLVIMALSRYGVASPRDVTRILDLGCGTGNYYPHFSQTFRLRSLVGVDFVEECVRTAMARGYSEGHVMNVRDIGDRFEPASFDLAISVEAYMYVAPEDRSEFLHGAFRVLEPGGTFILIGPNLQSWVRAAYGVSRGDFPFEFTLGDLVSEGEAAGFNVLAQIGSELLTAHPYTLHADHGVRHGLAFRTGVVFRKP